MSIFVDVYAAEIELQWVRGFDAPGPLTFRNRRPKGKAEETKKKKKVGNSRRRSRRAICSHCIQRQKNEKAAA